jgi:hypothetical protein
MHPICRDDFAVGLEALEQAVDREGGKPGGVGVLPGRRSGRVG